VDKLLGAGPIIATASTDNKLALARSLGADIAINYRQDDDWPNQVLAATDGRGADVILKVSVATSSPRASAPSRRSVRLAIPLPKP
jgi:NADPH:quinone reductase-like Zn-dependent oxidoreductase